MEWDSVFGRWRAKPRALLWLKGREDEIKNATQTIQNSSVNRWRTDQNCINSNVQQQWAKTTMAMMRRTNEDGKTKNMSIECNFSKCCSLLPSLLAHSPRVLFSKHFLTWAPLKWKYGWFNVRSSRWLQFWSELQPLYRCFGTMVKRLDGSFMLMEMANWAARDEPDAFN